MHSGNLCLSWLPPPVGNRIDYSLIGKRPPRPHMPESLSKIAETIDYPVMTLCSRQCGVISHSLKLRQIIMLIVHRQHGHMV